MTRDTKIILGVTCGSHFSVHTLMLILPSILLVLQQEFRVGLDTLVANLDEVFTLAEGQCLLRANFNASWEFTLFGSFYAEIAFGDTWLQGFLILK